MSNISGIKVELIELTEKKQQEIDKLLEKTQQQRDAIINDDIDNLLAITDLKQDIIDYIDKINEKFKESYVKAQKSPEFEEIKHYLQEKTKQIISVTDVIKTLEADNQRILKEKMKAVKKQIRDLKKSRKGISAYFQNMPESIYIDQKN
ncbi:MAG: flagellar export chaperone FlgN [Eubacteriales bacterium]|jgi:cell division septum initiation protein DivIVA|nr:flagellar export chaperone FlgN [Eubacteriales bacterium]